MAAALAALGAVKGQAGTGIIAAVNLSKTPVRAALGREHAPMESPDPTDLNADRWDYSVEHGTRSRWDDL